MLSPLHYQAHQAHFEDIRRRAAERPSVERDRTRRLRVRLSALLTRSAQSAQPAPVVAAATHEH
jgi:hypothetical protein